MRVWKKNVFAALCLKGLGLLDSIRNYQPCQTHVPSCLLCPQAWAFPTRVGGGYSEVVGMDHL